MGDGSQFCEFGGYSPQSVLKYLKGLVEFFVGHIQGHQQTDNVVVGACIQEKNPMLQTMMHQLLCGFAAVSSICFDKLYSLHGPQTAHVADRPMLLLPRSCLTLKQFAQGAGTRQQLAIGKFFEYRQCCGATCGVAPKSAAEATRSGGIHDLSAASDSGQGHPN